MAELRRTKAAAFDETEQITLQDLKDALWYYENENNETYIRHCIKPIEFAVKHLPKIWVFDTAIKSMTHGVDLKLPGVTKLESGIEDEDAVAIMTLKDELVGVGTARMNSEQILNEKKGIAVEVHKVFMKADLYP